MKIPDNIRINGVDYKIVYVPALNDGTNVAYGFIDFENSTIELNPERQAHQRMCATLWHEILHGIAFSMGIRETMGDNEEEIVDAFARGIYQVLQDNGRKLFDIKEPVAEETGEKKDEA